jgi:ABC-type molybdenum transport system ATPase subunit/photorepair protein PhrA
VDLNEHYRQHERYYGIEEAKPVAVRVIIEDAPDRYIGALSEGEPSRVVYLRTVPRMYECLLLQGPDDNGLDGDVYRVTNVYHRVEDGTPTIFVAKEDRSAHPKFIG